MNQAIIQCLQDVRNRLAVADNWIKGDYARDINGVVVSPTDEKACRWCVIGAVKAETRTALTRRQFVKDSLRQAVKESGYDGGLVAWQDDPGRTHQEVLAMIDLAIKMERATK